MTINLFDRTVSFLSKSLDMMSLRHQLIASNVANQDTPNFKSIEINFRNELEKVLDVKQLSGDFRTNPGHMPLNSPDISGIDSSLISESGPAYSYDNNSVNVEVEMANMARNTIMYNAAAQVITNKFRWLSFAIKEGR